MRFPEQGFKVRRLCGEEEEGGRCTKKGLLKTCTKRGLLKTCTTRAILKSYTKRGSLKTCPKGAC